MAPLAHLAPQPGRLTAAVLPSGPGNVALLHPLGQDFVPGLVAVFQPAPDFRRQFRGRRFGRARQDFGVALAEGTALSRSGSGVPTYVPWPAGRDM